MPVTLELGCFCNGADHSWDIRLKLNTICELLAAVIALDTYSEVAFDLILNQRIVNQTMKQDTHGTV